MKKFLFLILVFNVSNVFSQTTSFGENLRLVLSTVMTTTSSLSAAETSTDEN